MAVDRKEISQGLSHGRITPRLGIEVCQQHLLEKIGIADGACQHEFGEGGTAVGLDIGFRGPQTLGVHLINGLDEFVRLHVRISRRCWRLSDQNGMAGEDIGYDLDSDYLQSLMAFCKAVKEKGEVLRCKILDHH